MLPTAFFPSIFCKDFWILVQSQSSSMNVWITWITVHFQGNSKAIYLHSPLSGVKKNNAPETAQKILLKNVQRRFAWQVTFFESSSRRSHNKVGGASMWVCCKGQRPHGLCSSSLVPPADVLFLHVSTLPLPTSFSWLSFMPPSCPFLVCILFLFLFRFCFPFLSVFFSSFSPSLFLASQV